MMLSREDIVKELGNGISIYPFDSSKIKGNALNLSVSEHAWTLSEGSYTIGNTVYKKARGENAVIDINGEKNVIVFPLSTTLIETKEVIAVNNKLGGTYHSKVSIVSKGACHIGTYLEPNYRGHSLIAVQNMGKDPLLLKIGQTFVAITFFYLKSAVSESITGASNGRFDILANKQVILSDIDNNHLAEQWKSDKEQIKEKMKGCEEYIEFIKKERQKSIHRLKVYINWQNLIIVALVIIFLLIFYGLAYYIDIKYNNDVWRTRFWNVGCSGIVVAVITAILKNIKKR